MTKPVRAELPRLPFIPQPQRGAATALVRFLWLVTAPRRRRDELPRSCTWIPRVIAALTLASRIRIRPRFNKTQRVPQLFWDSSLEIWPIMSGALVGEYARGSITCVRVLSELQQCDTRSMSICCQRRAANMRVHRGRLSCFQVDQKLLSIVREAHPSFMELQDQSWKGVG
ncbi:hypothetical protein C8J57DRAFT_1230000 [Mycena rebaudengoi]|nr:hypothetical protein C8J57DRAFT_1230000 [Mycena rebaudengoi]